jgi:23S rRNA pseudouridine1911/1915/1917 synthase
MRPQIFHVEGEHALLPYLMENMPEYKRGEVKRLLRFGSVQVNGLRATRHDVPLRPGDEVRIESGRRKAMEGPATPGLDIVHEDDALFVINKPAGLLTVATPTEKVRTAHHELNEYIKSRGSRRGDRLFVVHRLDRETSGLLVFARTSEIRERLQEGWSQVEKRYYAVVEGLPRRDEGVIESRLAADERLRVRSVGPDTPGKLAITRYRVLRRGKRRALLDVQLETGRKNQIRVHLADINHPVVGDPKYGSKVGPGGRLALHAYRLAFTHPVTGEVLAFETPLPKAFEYMLER